MPVKICLITNYAYRLFNPVSRINFGGIETIFYILARDLAADKRFKLSFLLEDDIHKNPVKEKVNGITLYKTSRKIKPLVYHDQQIEKYHRWFTYWAGKFGRLWQLPHLDFFRLWEKLKLIRADIYIFASPGYESGLLVLIAKIIRKKSVYIVVNDELFQNKNRFYIYGLRHADVVLCYSLRHQRILKEKYQVKAIYLPPWLPRPKKIFPPGKKSYLLWVGRAEARKHPEAFINLAKNLPGLKFIMITAASPNEPDLYKTILKSATEAPNLQLIQDVMFNDLNQYFQKSLVFIDTSGYKNLNMTQIQAAYFKIPCLSLFEDPNDSFKDYHWGLSAKGDFKILIENIRAILNQPKLGAKMSQNAYRFADTVYNRAANLVAFKQLILSLAYN